MQAYLLLFLAKLLEQVGLQLEVADSQSDGCSAGVMPSKQKIQACILHTTQPP